MVSLTERIVRSTMPFPFEFPTVMCLCTIPSLFINIENSPPSLSAIVSSDEARFTKPSAYRIVEPCGRSERVFALYGLGFCPFAKKIHRHNQVNSTFGILGKGAR